MLSTSSLGPTPARLWNVIEDRLPLCPVQAPLAEELLAPVKSKVRDYSIARPVGDEAFGTFRSLYAYDRGPLEARLESVDESPRHYRDETISFKAAYGGERMTAHLLLPRNGGPPYQVVVFYPGGGAFSTPWTYPFTTFYVEFLLRSGRAVMYPLFRGMHERKAPDLTGPRGYRDRVLEWSKDLGRSLDYLETRADVDKDHFAFYGFSGGGNPRPGLHRRRAAPQGQRAALWRLRRGGRRRPRSIP